MNRLDYYKSQITDEEVVRALVKESRARTKSKKVRIRPNIKFLRRTVYDIMSTNERIDVHQQKIIEKEKQKSTSPKAKEKPARRKNFKKLVRDILSERPHIPDTDDEVTYVSTYKQLPSGTPEPMTSPATASSCDKTENIAVIVLDDSDESSTESSSDSDESSSESSESVIILSDTDDENSNKISSKHRRRKRRWSRS